MYRFIVMAGCLAATLFSLQSNAFTLRLSQQDVNQMVQMAFPQTQRYEGMIVTFTDPQLTFGSSDNEVVMDVTLSGKQGKDTFKAMAQLQGQLNYLGKKGELQIKRPQLNDFHVVENTLGDSQALLDTIENIKGKSAPIILLVDFSQVNLSFLGNQLPQRMVIENRQLVIDF